MKRILVSAAGGTPATNFVRSLRVMAEPVYIVGTDADPATLERAETDARYLVPLASDPNYLSVLNQIIEEERIEFVHAQNDHELAFLSRHRDAIHAKLFLPAKETVEICLDKFKSYEKWEAAGLTVPKTILLTSEDDLKRAFVEAGPRLWLRNVTGAAGNGSYPTDQYDEALEWVESHSGWGSFTAATCLRKDTVTWSSIWNNGALIVAQGRKRLSWELGNRAPSGVTGVTGTGVTYGDESLDQIALRTIAAIDPNPHGIFSVDFTYDQNGVPNPTEINIGRFFTTHFFFTKAGLNMPEILVRLAYAEPFPAVDKIYNPLPNGLAWVRGVDFEPVLTTEAAIAKHTALLNERLSRLA